MAMWFSWKLTLLALLVGPPSYWLIRQLGKRMKRASRVFFGDAAEAREAGFRPCGHCLRDDYARWKDHPADAASGNRR